MFLAVLASVFVTLVLVGLAAILWTRRATIRTWFAAPATPAPGTPSAPAVRLLGVTRVILVIMLWAALAIGFYLAITWADATATQIRQSVSAIKEATPTIAQAAEKGAKEGATKAVEAATPKVAEAAKSGAHEGATKAVESKPTPPAAPAPAPASPPAQQPQPTTPQPQAPIIGPSGYTDGQLATFGAANAQLAAADAKASADTAQKAKDDAEAIVVKAEAAAKVAEVAATDAKTEADKAKAQADAIAKAKADAEETAKASVPNITVKKSGSIFVAEASPSQLTGKYFWFEWRPCDSASTCQTKQLFGRASASRDAAIVSRDLPGAGWVRILYEDPAGALTVTVNGTTYRVSETAWLPAK